jgi:hypothetical protein
VLPIDNAGATLTDVRRSTAYASGEAMRAAALPAIPFCSLASGRRPCLHAGVLGEPSETARDKTASEAERSSER